MISTLIKLPNDEALSQIYHPINIQLTGILSTVILILVVRDCGMKETIFDQLHENRTEACIIRREMTSHTVSDTPWNPPSVPNHDGERKFELGFTLVTPTPPRREVLRPNTLSSLPPVLPAVAALQRL